VSKEVADDFVEALRKLEEDRDVEPLVEIHADDCEAGNVSVSETFRGHEGLREFWTEYRKTFGEMKSTFRNVFATGEEEALEWTTEGTSDGDSVSYDGVSILEVEGGKIRRFMAYFDSRRLTPPSRRLMVSRQPFSLTNLRIRVM
jgi:ketosteroid isomerase-like protein